MWRSFSNGLRAFLCPVIELGWVPATILLAGRWLYLQPGTTEAREWQLYQLYAATVFGCALLILLWRYTHHRLRLPRLFPRLITLIKAVLIVTTCVVMWPRINALPPVYNFLVFLPVTGLCALIYAYRMLPVNSPRTLFWATVFQSFLVLTIGLYFGLKLFFGTEQLGMLKGLPLTTRLTLMAGIMGGLTFLFSQPHTPRDTRFQWLRGTIWLPVAVLMGVVYSILWEYEVTTTARLHWNCMAAPAILLRQGATLLWDAPQQYGPGLTWLLATLPAEQMWSNVFYLYVVLQSFVTLVMTMALFSLIAPARKPGLFNLLLRSAGYVLGLVAAIALALTSFDFLHILTGYPLYMTPSASAVRFIWAVVLLCWCYRVFRRQSMGDAMTRWQTVTGITFYLLAVVWSFESAFFATAIFVPAYSLFRIADLYATGERRVRIFIGSFFHSLWHIASALLLLFAAISAYYHFVLHLTPHWQSYFDFAMSYKAGYFSLPIHWHSHVQYVLSVSIALFGVPAYLFRRPLSARTLSTTAMQLTVAIFLWAVCAYSVSRSHDNLFITMSSYGLLALSVSAMALRHVPGEMIATLLVRCLLIASCATLAYGIAGTHPKRSKLYNFPPGDIVKLLPYHITLREALQETEGLPVAIMETPNYRTLADLPTRKAFLPLLTHIYYDGMGPLSGPQYVGYYERFIERQCYPEGWLMINSSPNRFTYLKRFLDKHFILEEVRYKKDWQMYKYRRREPCPQH